MKFAIGLLSVIVSTSAYAANLENEPTIFLSCSGITYDNKHALQLNVTQLSKNRLRADVRATNGERISIAMKHGFGMLVPVDSNQNFTIFLQNTNSENEVLLRWPSEVLRMQYSHQPMTCALPEKENS